MTGKQRISEQLLAREVDNLAVSVQVLGEFYSQVTRQSRRRVLSHNEAVAAIEGLRSYRVQPLTLETFNQAMRYRERFSLSYWGLPDTGGCEAEWLRRRVLRGHERQSGLRRHTSHQPLC